MPRRHHIVTRCWARSGSRPASRVPRPRRRPPGWSGCQGWPAGGRTALRRASGPATGSVITNGRRRRLRAPRSACRHRPMMPRLTASPTPVPTPVGLVVKWGSNTRAPQRWECPARCRPRSAAGARRHARGAGDAHAARPVHVLQRMVGVDQQVEQHLVQLVGVGVDRRQVVGQVDLRRCWPNAARSWRCPGPRRPPRSPPGRVAAAAGAPSRGRCAMRARSVRRRCGSWRPRSGSQVALLSSSRTPPPMTAGCSARARRRPAASRAPRASRAGTTARARAPDPPARACAR